MEKEMTLTGGGGMAASNGAKKRSSYVSVDGLGYARSPPRMSTSPLGSSFAIGLAWLSEEGLPDVEVAPLSTDIRIQPQVSLRRHKKSSRTEHATRDPGMTMHRLSLSVWSVLVTAFLLVLLLPVLVGKYTAQPLGPACTNAVTICGR